MPGQRLTPEKPNAWACTSIHTFIWEPSSLPPPPPPPPPFGCNHENIPLVAIANRNTLLHEITTYSHVSISFEKTDSHLLWSRDKKEDWRDYFNGSQLINIFCFTGMIYCIWYYVSGKPVL